MLNPSHPESSRGKYQAIYHEKFDTVGPREMHGEIGCIIDDLEEILYPSGETAIRANNVTVQNGLQEATFDRMFPTRINGLGHPVENTNLRIKHVQRAGEELIYDKFYVDSIVSVSNIRQEHVGKLVTKYTFEEHFTHRGSTYYGTILRPDIGFEKIDAEDMTAVDCRYLSNLFQKLLITSINEQAKNANS